LVDVVIGIEFGITIKIEFDITTSPSKT